ncbi:unnamed protein product [Diatraea saccharalis]|uniref:Zinc finger PHD-type domain-containing protein n=1 Tax=Diatraea saccharalis TaxID=40085 RepID=A0A9N9R600_9NEOP|nr:unnamed protein product [Diatraea saccharalis]
MPNCGACGRFLSPVGAATCGDCLIKYHRVCANISEKAQISKDWVCSNCKKDSRRGDNRQTPVKRSSGTEISAVSSRGLSPSSHRVLASDSRQFGEDVGDHTDVGGLREFFREFKEGMEEIRDFRREMAKLRESFTAYTERLDGLERRLEAVEKRRDGGDSARVAELKSAVSGLKQELNDREQEMLLSDLEIGHLPEERGTSVFQAVAVLAGRLGVTLEERDVVFAERVGPTPAEKEGRPRRMVVRLARRQLRDDLLQAARVRRAGLASATVQIVSFFAASGRRVVGCNGATPGREAAAFSLSRGTGSLCFDSVQTRTSSRRSARGAVEVPFLPNHSTIAPYYSEREI